MKSILLSIGALLGIVVCGTSGNIPQTQATAFDLCNQDCADLGSGMMGLGYSTAYTEEYVSKCNSDCGQPEIQVKYWYDCDAECSPKILDNCKVKAVDWDYCKYHRDQCADMCPF
ncbi:hypothetical protein FGO68_gene86 [Halteria grandinella]|uniref:Uncharacterized protein n=1 Tax=Halteria grandinella TaxID=5974 RepID=A0A8J8NIK0_HALGN|nr:hypothetical protein FGO68_gene86 [Halteria grandinella]